MSEFQVASRLQRHDLHKLHGLGNDFLVWFRSEVPSDASERARLWCDRHRGIGADGLIVAIDDRVAPRFVLFNADGSRAEISGNGLRCFGHAVCARRGLDEAQLIVETDAGGRAVIVNGATTQVARVSAAMGAPARGPSLDPVDLAAIVEHRSAMTVDLGNPHVVIEVDAIDGLEAGTIGPMVEAHFLPTGINVHLFEVTDVGARMLIWERGVGVTDACGSGACAVAAVLAAAAPDAQEFTIDMPGGVATVNAGDELHLHGPSTYVAAIEPGVL